MLILVMVNHYWSINFMIYQLSDDDTRGVYSDSDVMPSNTQISIAILNTKSIISNEISMHFGHGPD